MHSPITDQESRVALAKPSIFMQRAEYKVCTRETPRVQWPFSERQANRKRRGSCLGCPAALLHHPSYSYLCDSKAIPNHAVEVHSRLLEHVDAVFVNPEFWSYDSLVLCLQDGTRGSFRRGGTGGLTGMGQGVKGPSYVGTCPT